MRRAMMGFVHVTVAMLSLLSVGQSVPVTTCESLIQQVEIQGREQLLGKWMLIGESTNIPGIKLLMKLVDTAWVKITAANENDGISILQAQKMFGRCSSLTTTMNLENSTLSKAHPFRVSEVLLSSGCPDCLLFQSNHTLGGNTYTGLQFLSKRSKVSAAEMEEFKKQVECLKLPPPTIPDPEKGFCPDESTETETETTDLTSALNDVDPEHFKLLENIITNNDGMKVLLKVISSGIGLKEN